MDSLKMRGQFVLEQIRNDKVISKITFHNGITDEGKDEILKTMFSAESARIDAWYVGLIVGASAPTLADGDTMASHAGWTEIPAASVAELVRQDWLDSDNVADQEITNAAVVEYTLAVAATIRGLFITSDDTLEGSTGVLWSTGTFTTAINGNISDKIRVTYTLSVD
jgi:hypothetical protein